MKPIASEINTQSIQLMVSSMQLSSSTSKSRDPVKDKELQNVKMKISETRDKVRSSLEENPP